MFRYLDWAPESDSENVVLLHVAGTFLRAAASVNSELFLMGCIKLLIYSQTLKKRSEILPLVFSGIAVAYARRAISARKPGFKRAAKMMRISESLADLYSQTPETCHSVYVSLAYINHWIWPLKTCLEPLVHNFKQSLLFGESGLAGRSFTTWLRYKLQLTNTLSFSLFSGESLAYVESVIDSNW